MADGKHDQSSELSTSERDSDSGELNEKNKDTLFPTASGPDHFPHKLHSWGSHCVHFSLDPVYSRTKGRISRNDGRLKLSVNETANRGFLARALGTGIRRHLGTQSPLQTHEGKRRLKEARRRPTTQEDLSSTESIPTLPGLNIVIMVIGSRGDIQPFIKIARVLKEKHHHRVRVATHPAFKKFVEDDCGLEFFSAGGDPSELMAYMIKNPGLLPSFQTIKEGEIKRRRKAMADMFRGFWSACVESSDDSSDSDSGRSFVADAIISNPPVMCHIDIAERLGCPLHIMFTFPYTPTQSFPHPLANIKKSNVDESYTNFMSYPLVEIFTWQGLGDLVNEFRSHTLGLDPVSTLWAPGQLYRLKVPHTYLWSPGLVPKPHDWGPEIDIAGFVFLDLASSFEPPTNLAGFLDSGEPPVYIGFGSIVVDDPDEFTKVILEAVAKAGVRALISKGWGGIGEGGDVPENVFMLDNVPHDWLFPRCKAVVHHGGAGTTAVGLKCGIPTLIVPFFGDQPFWGSMIANAKAGSHRSIPYRDLTSDRLADGIRQCLANDAKSNAQRIAKSIAEEGDGAENAVNSFHERLPMTGSHSMRCTVFDDHSAVWQLKDSDRGLSTLAANLLVSDEKLSYDQLRLWRTYEWNDFQGPGGPVTGAGSALFKFAAGFGKGAAGAPLVVSKDVADLAHYEKRKYKHGKRKQKQREAMDAKGGPTEATGIIEDFKTFTAADRDDIENERQKSSSEPESSTSADQHEESDDSHADYQESGNKAITRADTDTSNFSASTPHKSAGEIVHDGMRKAVKPAKATAKFPMDLFLGVANGFHNLPRLYGDDTVRRPVRIEDMRSGLEAAGKEFAWETHDAMTGVWKQPVEGYRKEGASGVVSGLGKGVGGVLVKGTAAVMGPPAFVMKGMHKEFTKHKTPVAQIREARILQGKRELAELDEDARNVASETACRWWQTMSNG